MTITPARTHTTAGTRQSHRRRTAAIVVMFVALAAVVTLIVWLLTTTGPSRTVQPANESPIGSAQLNTPTVRLPAAGGHLPLA